MGPGMFFQLKAVILAFQVWSWMNLTAAPDFKMLEVRINNWYQLIGYRNITVRCIYNKIYSEWYSRLLSILVNLKNNSSINSHEFQLHHGLSRCGGLHKYLFVGTFVINVDFVLERKSYPRSWLVYKTLGGFCKHCTSGKRIITNSIKGQFFLIIFGICFFGVWAGTIKNHSKPISFGKFCSSPNEDFTFFPRLPNTLWGGIWTPKTYLKHLLSR